MTTPSVSDVFASTTPASYRNPQVEYSVVISTLGERPTLHTCLDSVRAQRRPPKEIVVCLPEGASFNEVNFAQVVRVAVPSTSGQRNAGWRAATAPVVLFVDDDIELENDFAAELMAVWERRGLNGLSGVMGTCVNEDRLDGVPPESLVGRVVLAGFQLSHRAVVTKGSRLMLSGSVAKVHHPAQEVEVDFAKGYCVSYRRDLLEHEPFDERFAGYVFYEDMDIAARMRAHAPLVHTPRARCRQLPVTPGVGSGTVAAYRRGRMATFFRHRHRAPGAVGRLAWEWSNAAEAAIIAARCLRARDSAPVRAYLRGLRETRADIRRPSASAVVSSSTPLQQS